MNGKLLRGLALGAMLALAGCTTMADPTSYLVEASGPYLLDSGDAVRVTVYGDAGISNAYRVDDSGAISMPLIGSVQVRGLTTETAARRISGELAAGFIRNPNVAVEVAEYRPFFIQGAVNQSGGFPYIYGMTVRAAISLAGGYVDTADRDSAIVYRRQGTEMVTGTVGLDFPILPGDVIVINERWL